MIKRYFYLFLCYNEIGGIMDYNYEENMHKVRKNGLLLTDKQVNVLEKYNINYNMFKSMNDLICEIEDILNNDYYEDLDNVSQELAEYNYYNNTNK